jgi:hypothetical protein
VILPSAPLPETAHFNEPGIPALSGLTGTAVKNRLSLLPFLQNKITLPQKRKRGGLILRFPRIKMV